MKLALLPMVDQRERTKAIANEVEQRAEHGRIGELLRRYLGHR